MPNRTNKIKQSEYEHLRTIDVAYEGFVEGTDGELFYVYCEATVVGHFENMWHISYDTSTRSYEVPVHPADNTRVANSRDQISYQPESVNHSTVQNNVRKQLLESLLACFQLKEYEERKRKDDKSLLFGIYGPSDIPMDVSTPRTHYQKEYVRLKQKIVSGTIRREDFPGYTYNSGASKREIDTWFACFDPKDPGYNTFWGIEAKLDLEDFIPVWVWAARRKMITGIGISY